MAGVTQTSQPRPPDGERTAILRERMRAASRGVRRRLLGGPRPAPAEALRALATRIEQGPDPTEWDLYGDGGPVPVLEARVAELLGKPAAVMFPSGIMAQQSALRIWTDRTGSRRVAIPALSHLLVHELDGPRLLHGLRYELLTTGPVVPTAADLAAIPGELGAALLELPLRDAGYLLPSWEGLVAFADACRERGVPLHLDGARLWESTPHLGHDLAQVAALADSVYVSLYKGLGGLAGAVLAGSDDVVAEARQWRRRLGGTLFTLLPYAVSALAGLDTEVPRMAEYHERAVEIAALLAAAGFQVHPEVPHTNAFRIHAAGTADDLNERLVSVAETEQVQLLSGWQMADVPGRAWSEFTVGPATLEWDPQEAVQALAAAFLPRQR